MKHKYTIIKFAIITLLPVLAAQGFLAPLWFSQTYGNDGKSWLPDVEIIVTGVLVPGWIGFLATLIVLRQVSIGLTPGLTLLAGAFALNLFLDYALWGIGSGMFWTPDAETIRIIQAMALVGFCIASIPPSIAFVIRFGGKKQGTLK